jgi:hypothetical protein
MISSNLSDYYKQSSILRLRRRQLTKQFQDNWSNKSMVGQSVQRAYDDLYEEYHSLKDGLGMAKKEAKLAEWKEHVDVRLSREAEDAYDKWKLSEEELWDMLISLTEQGYKFSISFIIKNKSFVATFTGRVEGLKNAGMSMSSYSDDWLEAIRLLVYKHAVLTDQDWKGYASEQPSRRG